MIYKFKIYGTLPSLDNLLNADNGEAVQLLEQSELYINHYIKAQLANVKIYNPIMIIFKFFEPVGNRELSDIASFAHITIIRALRQAHVLNQYCERSITGFSDYYDIDRQDPRIEITIIEV